MAENWRIITTRRLRGIGVRDALKNALLLHALCGMPLVMAENPAARVEMPAVEVIGTTPLRASGCRSSRCLPSIRGGNPGNVQSTRYVMLNRRGGVFPHARGLR